MTTLRYHPFFCEENVWHLCQTSHLAQSERHIVFISNRTQTVLFCNQRAGGTEGVVFWDYHVVLMVHDAHWRVWDLDAVDGAPMDAREYVSRAFPYLTVDTASQAKSGSPSLAVPTALTPAFRVIDAREYIAHFASDRRHMRDDSGAWRQPPPPWDCLGVGHTLHRFLDFESAFHGEVLDFEGFVERYAS